MDHTKFTRELGAELRELRTAQGLTRPRLVDEVSTPISVRALVAYERGERELSAFNLVELCRALRCEVVSVVSAVVTRLGAADPADLRVDLRVVAADHSPDLLSLRKWARVQLADVADEAPAVVHLSPDAVDALAELCDLRPAALIRRVQGLPRRSIDGAR